MDNKLSDHEERELILNLLDQGITSDVIINELVATAYRTNNRCMVLDIYKGYGIIQSKLKMFRKAFGFLDSELI